MSETDGPPAANTTANVGLSFITVSNNPTLVARLGDSIALTLGSAIAWELIEIDGTKHDIFNGYNRGAAQARFDRLLFVHNDVEFLGNWLTFRDLVSTLDDPATGVVGAVGVRFILPSGTWWGPGVSMQQTLGLSRGMALHPVSEVELGVCWNMWPGPAAAQFGRVIVVDGLLLACHRRAFDHVGGFDAQTFKGFHFYDIDFSLRAHLAGLRNMVVPLPVRHGSRGRYDQVWDRARQVFARKHAASVAGKTA